MFRTERNSSLCTVVAAAVLILGSGCGSNSSHPSNNAISPAQAQAVTSEVSLALAQALSNSFGVPAARPGVPSLSAIAADISSDFSSSACTVTSTGETCNWPVSYNGPCPGGGTISVTGDVTGTLDNNGNGSVLTQLTVTPANCSVSSLVISGDPNISVDGQINFTQTAPSFPITLTEIGGVSYGPSPSGVCQFNVKYTLSSQTSCTISGTACGQTVSGSC
jgi:hypothetical protein